MEIVGDMQNAKTRNKPQSNAFKSKQSNQAANKRPKAVHDSCDDWGFHMVRNIACLPDSPGREKCNPMAHLHTKPFDCGPKAQRRWLQMAHKQLLVCPENLSQTSQLGIDRLARGVNPIQLSQNECFLYIASDVWTQVYLGSKRKKSSATL